MGTHRYNWSRNERFKIDQKYRQTKTMIRTFVNRIQYRYYCTIIFSLINGWDLLNLIMYGILYTDVSLTCNSRVYCRWPGAHSIPVSAYSVWTVGDATCSSGRAHLVPAGATWVSTVHRRQHVNIEQEDRPFGRTVAVVIVPTVVATTGISQIVVYSNPFLYIYIIGHKTIKTQRYNNNTQFTRQ